MNIKQGFRNPWCPHRTTKGPYDSEINGYFEISIFIPNDHIK